MYSKYKNKIPALKYLKLSKDGKYIIYPESATVIAYNQNNKILLIRQFRSLLSKYTLEFPGGVIEKNESIVSGALREYREETGYHITDIKYMTTLDMDVSLTNHKTHLFRAKIIEENIVEREKGIELVWMEIEDIIKNINNGNISHAPTVVASLWFFINKRSLHC